MSDCYSLIGRLPRQDKVARVSPFPFVYEDSDDESETAWAQCSTCAQELSVFELLTDPTTTSPSPFIKRESPCPSLSYDDSLDDQKALPLSLPPSALSNHKRDCSLSEEYKYAIPSIEEYDSSDDYHQHQKLRCYTPDISDYSNDWPKVNIWGSSDYSDSPVPSEEQAKPITFGMNACSSPDFFARDPSFFARKSVELIPSRISADLSPAYNSLFVNMSFAESVAMDIDPDSLFVPDSGVNHNDLALPSPVGLGISGVYMNQSDDADLNSFLRVPLYDQPVDRYSLRDSVLAEEELSDEPKSLAPETAEHQTLSLGLEYLDDSSNESEATLGAPTITEGPPPCLDGPSDHRTSNIQGPGPRKPNVMVSVVIERMDLDVAMWPTLSKEDLDLIEKGNEPTMTKRKRGRPVGSTNKVKEKANSTRSSSGTPRRSTRDTTEPVTYNATHLGALSLGYKVCCKRDKTPATKQRGRPRKDNTDEKRRPGRPRKSTAASKTGGVAGAKRDLRKVGKYGLRKILPVTKKFGIFSKQK